MPAVASAVIGMAIALIAMMFTRKIKFDIEDMPDSQ
jgi:hypothetical protein